VNEKYKGSTAVSGRLEAMDASFSQLLARLETVTARLESVEASTGGGGGGSVGLAGARASAGGAGGDGPSVAAFDALVQAYMLPFRAAAAKVGPDAQKQAAHVAAAFDAQRRFLVLAAACSKPSAEEMPMLLQETSKAIGETQAAVDRRAADFNCLNAVGEGIAALGWVVVDPTPVPHIEEMKNASDFYGTKASAACLPACCPCLPAAPACLPACLLACCPMSVLTACTPSASRTRCTHRCSCSTRTSPATPPPRAWSS